MDSEKGTPNKAIL